MTVRIMTLNMKKINIHLKMQHCASTTLSILVAVYAECRAVIVTLILITLNVIMLNVIMLNVIM